jgi:hypothetical protein
LEILESCDPICRLDSAARIKRIAALRPIESYLEIGVSEGKTFNELDFPYKVGVDPHFKFDTARFKEPNRVELYELTSDAFFTTYDKRQSFDFIFVDGLHTFQQTLRDFNNALAFSHRGTVILIDDVYPWDVFSAIPDQQRAISERRRVDAAHPFLPAWHGDVYKVVMAIHDFFPTISYRTIDVGFGNSQTLCVRKPRTEFAPHFTGLEQIERLSYFDLLDNLGLLNLVPEDQALQWAAETAPR